VPEELLEELQLADPSPPIVDGKDDDGTDDDGAEDAGEDELKSLREYALKLSLSVSLKRTSTSRDEM
jgi:hypothetical protein